MLKLPIVKDLLRFSLTELWLLDVNEYRGWKRFGIRIARDLTISILRYRESESDVQSAALTSITLLSLVPMLAFGFTIAKSMGYYRRLQLEVIEPAMNDWLGMSDAPELRSALEQMLTFVENTDFSSLGVIGLITILYAVIRLLSAVEASLNDLWQAKSHVLCCAALRLFVGDDCGAACVVAGSDSQHESLKSLRRVHLAFLGL